MNVRELISKLEEYDPEINVVVEVFGVLNEIEEVSLNLGEVVLVAED